MPDPADGDVPPAPIGLHHPGTWKVWALLGVGLTLSVLAAGYTRATVDAAQKREFAFVCDQIRGKTLDRLLAHEQILRSAAAFFEQTADVSREDWHRFTARNRVEQQLPGVQGLGFSQRIPRAELAAHTAQIRAEGYPAYEVHPVGDRETYSSIIYLEPFTGRNLRAFGFDMFNEPIRRAAMERARDQNVAALSAKVVLVQETSRDVQAGTLMYVPVYRTDLPTATVAERRAALRGWVYSPYRMRDLMQNIMGAWDVANERRIRLEVFDGDHEAPGALLYDSQPGAQGQGHPRLFLQRRLRSAGRPWMLQFTKTGQDSAGRQYAEVWLALFGGVTTSVLLSVLLYSLLSVRRRAEQLAWQLTTKLRENDTKLREVNLQLEKARESSETANLAKTRFLANMSHEMRTPLNAILGFAQVIARDSSFASKQVEYARTIIRNSDHLSRLINDVLDMSKIEAGQIQLKPVTFCFHDLLDDLKTVFHARAIAKGLQFVVDIDDSVPHDLLGDEGKIRQILLNLLGNAVKFTAHGEVRLRVRAEAVPDALPSGARTMSLVVDVEDTGPGVTVEDVSRLFAAFVQTEAGAKAGGSGLGLSISRRLAEAMGGSLTVESEPDKGSRFSLAVPVVLVEGAAPPKKRKPRRIVGLKPGTGRVCVLVVDDARDNRSLLRAVLGRVGFEVIEAEDGAEALETFARTSPEAVLMDMRMPVMDGYEATRRLRATDAGRTTLIIAVTAIAFEDARQEVMDTGVDACLTKPVQIDLLLELLRSRLNLTYVYSDDSMPPPPADTRAPRPELPEALLRNLRQAVAEGDTARLYELIAEVESLSVEAAQRLRSMADQYDYEKLNVWLA